MTKIETAIRLDHDDRPYVTAHDSGAISIHQSSINGRWSLHLPYEAIQDIGPKFHAAIQKARALRAIHNPEKPPCEPAPTEDAPIPEASPAGTGDPAVDT